MGYTPPERAYSIKYADHPGLQLRARSVPLGQFMALSRLSDMYQAAQGNTEANAAMLEQGLEMLDVLRQLFEGFAGALVEWNLEVPAGTPVPRTVDGLLGLDPVFAMELLDGWLGAIGGAERPLSSPSSDGALAASLPMEPLGTSQAS